MKKITQVSTSMAVSPLLRARGMILRFLASEDGPTAIEYAMMTSLIIAVCVLAIGAFGTSTSTSFNNTANSIINATGGS